MKLYVLEKTNGAVECVGIVAKDVNSLCELMNFVIVVNDGTFETIPNEDYEKYNKEQSGKYRYPYNPFIEKYKLIFECKIDDKLKEGCVFRVEE